MEIQLHELIEQIKKDGVSAAEEKAAAIINDAEEKAAGIIAEAKAQADRLIAEARAENAKTVKSGEDALRQAGRNLLISFRESVAKQLQALVGKNVNEVYSSAAFAGLIESAVAGWAGKPEADDLAVILNSDDLARMENTLLAALREKIGEGVTLKASDRFDGGFRIAVNNGAVYYDYSAEAVTDMLSAYLSPRVAQLLKEAE